MKVAILGCGAYGLALASILVKNKVVVTMWSYSNEEKEILTKSRKSNKLENYKIPECINFSYSNYGYTICNYKKKIKRSKD